MNDHLSNPHAAIRTPQSPGCRSAWRLLLILLFFMLGSSCTYHAYRFADREPVWKIDDHRPIPLPKATRFIRMDYYYKVLVRKPGTKLIDYSKPGRSLDVNSMDHVPASSWFTPRLGYQELTAADMLNGPVDFGPPQLPVRVVRAKSLGSNPGFIIADNRDRLYLVKFDPPGYPAIQTAAALIVNRLFWAFGYNVPEDYLFYLTENDLEVDPTADITYEEVQLVFNAVALPQDGVHRTTVSRLLDGIYLGPLVDTGVRKDDPNDQFSHEDRRVLRALRVFGAFTNQTDIRIDNSLDVYTGMAGEGYVKHYLLDFGEALGGHGAEHNRIWDGYRHIFSFREMFTNFATLGFRVEDWEKIHFTPWESVGAFEAEYFEPQKWRETYPFAPIRNAQQDDNYWAAKVVAAIGREQLEGLIAEADYPEPEAAEYIVDVLMARRQKIIDYYYSKVSPIEAVSADKTALIVEDTGLKDMSNPGDDVKYEVRFFNDGKREVADLLQLRQTGSRITIPLNPDLFEEADNYMRIEITVWRDRKAAPRPAQFHLRRRADGSVRLVGVVH